jgi:annexin A7/11
MPSGGMPSGGMPSGGMPSGGMPSGGMPSGGMPSGGMPSGGMPSGGMTSGGMPSGGMPSGGMQPANPDPYGLPGTNLPYSAGGVGPTATNSQYLPGLDPSFSGGMGQASASQGYLPGLTPAATGGPSPMPPANQGGLPGLTPGYPSAAPAQPTSNLYPSADQFGSSAGVAPFPMDPLPVATGYSGSTDAGNATGFACALPHEDIYAPTLKPYPNFDANLDCERLRKAMKGLGTDEKTIIEIMGHRTVDQRVKIVQQYKTMYGRDLVKDFRSDLTGHFQDVIEALCFGPAELDAFLLRNAVKGAGTDEGCLIDILCTRNNEQIRKIKEAYSKMYEGRNLEKDVISDTSRHFKRIMVSMLQANRDESTVVDKEQAKRDAEDLYRAGEKRLGTDESTFNMILAQRSFMHLRAVFDEYMRISKHDIENALKKEMSGDLLKSMLAIVRCIKNKPKYFAYQLMKSMKGAGTRDTALIRIVVTRCEVDMAKIKEEFQRDYGKSLETWITGDTTRDYRKILIALVSG